MAWLAMLRPCAGACRGHGSPGHDAETQLWTLQRSVAAFVWGRFWRSSKMWFGDFIRFLVKSFSEFGRCFFFLNCLCPFPIFSTFSNNGPRKSSFLAQCICGLSGLLLPGFSRSSATSPWSQRYPASTIHSPSVSRLRTAPLKSDRKWKSTIRDLSPIDVWNWNSNVFICGIFWGSMWNLRHSYPTWKPSGHCG